MLDRDVRRRDERALVLAQGEERRQDDDFAVESRKGDRPAALVDELEVLGCRPIEGQAPLGRAGLVTA